MATIKQILRLPLRLARRMKVAEKIRRLDAATDQTRKASNHKMDHGWDKTNIDSFLDSPGITQQLKTSPLRQRPDQDKKIRYNWDIPAFVWRAVLDSEVLYTTVRNYLGDGVRLDDMYIKTIEDGFESGAEGWHDDNVGYRLKAFLIFDVEGTPSDTLIIPQKRPNLYRIKIKEEVVRMLGAPDVGDRKEEVRIRYQSGDCLIFDTNLLHRGDYTHSNGIRYCLVIEFMDRKKSDHLKGIAPCSPGQGKFPIHIPINDLNYIDGHRLLDKNILKMNDGKIWYG